MGVQSKDQRRTRTTVRPVSTELPLRIEKGRRQEYKGLRYLIVLYYETLKTTERHCRCRNIIMNNINTAVLNDLSWLLPHFDLDFPILFSGLLIS